MRDSVKMTYPATVLTTLAAAALASVCAAAEAKGPRFPDPLPPHTRIAYAQSYGGIVGGHAYVIVATGGRARVKCRFEQHARLRQVNPHKWDKVLDRAHLDKVKSDDPERSPVESPELWIRYRGRVTYRQSFSHKNGYPQRVADVQNAFEQYLGKVCRSS